MALKLGLSTARDRLLPKAAVLPAIDADASASSAAAVLVLSPGGLERLSLEPLGDDVVATVGYNVKDCVRVPGCQSLCYCNPPSAQLRHRAHHFVLRQLR